MRPSQRWCCSPVARLCTVRDKHPALRFASLFTMTTRRRCASKFLTESSLNQAWFCRVRCAKLRAEIFITAEVHHVIDSYVCTDTDNLEIRILRTEYPYYHYSSTLYTYRGEIIDLLYVHSQHKIPQFPITIVRLFCSQSFLAHDSQERTPEHINAPSRGSPLIFNAVSRI